MFAGRDALPGSFTANGQSGDRNWTCHDGTQPGAYLWKARRRDHRSTTNFDSDRRLSTRAIFLVVQHIAFVWIYMREVESG